MSGKNKHIKTDRETFLRYIGNQMSDAERNAFERELEKDPFAAEALQGFDGISAEELKTDLGNLERAMPVSSPVRKLMPWYRIAASVAVLMLVSSLY